MTITITPAITDTKPMVKGQVILPHVLMQEKMTVATIPTKVNATEQAPWSLRAFRAMDMAKREEPVQKIKAMTNITPEYEEVSKKK